MLDGDARFKPLPTPPGMEHELYTFQEAGHGWLRLLGDLGIGCVLADDMGLGKTVQAIAMIVSEREQYGDGALGADARRLPDERRAPVAARGRALRARAATCISITAPTGSRARRSSSGTRQADIVITSYDIATRDVETLQLVHWDRLLLDEAQDVKNPQTRRARSLRLLRARRRVAMTGTPIENHLGELWAIMDLLNPGLLGSREWFHRAFVEPIQIDDDPDALERLRAIVRPFILRRRKDDPEVELDLPPITMLKDYCLLTQEQAVLYQQVIDSWLPRVEAHDDRFGRRGAVLAMLGQLKQVCNHPEMVLHEGGPLDGRSGQARASRRAAEARAEQRQGARVHAVHELRRARSAPRRAARQAGRLLPRLAQRVAARGAADGVRVAGRTVGARRLAARRRARSQPAGGEPRLPFRPLVEPGGRAAGVRPCAPARPGEAGVGALADHVRHARGPDRPAARVEEASSSRR